MTDEQRNYQSALGNEKLVDERIKQHLDAKAIRISTEEDINSPDFLLNPLGAIVKNDKVNLLIHWALNDAYKKPNFRLSQLDCEFHDFTRFKNDEYLDKIDLSGAYK